MKKKSIFKRFLPGLIWLAVFVLWTLLVCVVDVQPIGPEGSPVGFATINGAFHQLTGEHMALYSITDIVEYIPILICAGFGVLGLTQLIRRKNLWKVDRDILVLGTFYLVVIGFYLLFEVVHVNYRTVLIDGALETSYPSSTTLLSLSVMLSLLVEINLRVKDEIIRKRLRLVSIVFAVLMVIARLISGVHWLTDIIGGVVLSIALVQLFAACIGPEGKKH